MSSSQCSIKKTISSYSRKLFLIVAILFCSSFLWGVTYYWRDAVTEGDWSVSDNWSTTNANSNYNSGTYPQEDDTVYITGNIPVTINFTENSSVKYLYLNNSNPNLIILNTNGKAISVGWFMLNISEGTGNSNSNVEITGGGSLTIPSSYSGLAATKFDFPDSYDSFVTIDSGTTFAIYGTYYGNGGTGYMYFYGDGTLSIPASGANLDWGTSRIRYSSDLNIIPNQSPTYYYLSNIGQSLPMNVTVNCNRATNGNAAVFFPYKVERSAGSTATYSFNGANVSDGDSGSIQVAGNATSTTQTLAKTGNEATGEGITIIIYTPDGALELGRLSFYQDVTVWKGTTSNEWDDDSNWSNNAPGNTADVIINSGVTNYPVISSDVTINSLTITSNANVAMTNGTLTLSSLVCTGNSNFSATGGTVAFTGTASWEAEYPSNSQFSAVKILADSKLTAKSDMTLTGTFTNNLGGKFTSVANNATVYFTPSSDFEIIGSATASDTSFYALSCTESGGNTLTFTNDIFVNNLCLTGDSTVSRLTIAGNTGSSIQLSSSQMSGQFLQIEGSAPVITDGSVDGGYTYTTYGSISSITPPVTGWVIGDADSVIWTGSISNNWNVVGNWSTGAVPATNAKVVIPGSGITTYPKLSAAVDIATGSILIDSGASLDLNGYALTAGSLTINGTLRLKGSETFTNVTTITMGNTSTVLYYGTTATTENLASKLSSTFPNLTVYSSATLTLSGDITLTGNFTNYGTFNANGKTVSFTPYTTSVIWGETTFAGLSCSSQGGKTLTINSNIDVTTLALSGSSTSSKLTVSGSGSIDLSSNQTGGVYLKVDTIPISTNTYAVTYSVSVTDPAPTGWSGFDTSSDFTWTGTNDNSWTDDENWGRNDGKYPGSVSGSADNVEIPAGLINYPIVTSSDSVSIAEFTMASGAEITLNENSGFTVTDSWTNEGTVYVKGSLTTLSLPTEAEDEGSWVFNGTTGTVYSGLEYKNITVNSGCSVVVDGAIKTSSLTNNGTYSTSSYITSVASYSGTGTLTLGGGTFIQTATGDTTIAKVELTTSTSSTLNSGLGTFTVSDFTGNSADLSIKGIVSLPSVTGGISLGNFTVSTGGTCTLNGDVTANGDFSNSGTLDLEGNTLSAETYSGTGSITTTNGTITATGNGGTIPTLDVTNGVTINGGTGTDGITVTNAVSNGIITSGKTSLNGTSITTLTNSGTLTLNGNLTASGLVTNNGIIDLVAKTLSFLTYSGTIDTVKVNGGIVTATGAGGIITTLTVDTSGVTINGGTGANGITVTNAVSNGIITSGKTSLNGTSIITLTNSGTLTLNGNLTASGLVTNNGTIDLAANTLSFLTYSGTSDIVRVNGGIVTATGAGGTISTLEATTGATINGGTTGVTVDAATYNSTPMITTTGIVTLPGGTIGALTVGDDVLTTSTLTIGGNLTASSVMIKSGATLVAGTDADDAYIITVDGNWTNNADASGFTAQNSTVEFTANSTITGSNTFYDLKCTTADTILSFTAGTTQTITGIFTTTGTSDHEIVLQSSASGSTWTIIPAAVSVTFTNIQDSINTGAGKTCGNGCTSLGNNTGWIFPDPVWIGGTETIAGSGVYSWATPANWSTNSVPVTTNKITYSAACTTYPSLVSDVEIKSITIPSGMSLTLAGYNLTVNGTDAGSFENNGIINTTGGKVVLSAEASENGTWNYSGGTVSAITNLTYNKLEISGAVNASGDIAATNGISITSTGTITLTAATTFKSAVTLSANTTFNTSSYALGFDEAISCSTDYANSLITTGTGVVTFGGEVKTSSVEIAGASTIGTNITTTGDQTYSGNVTFGADTTLLANATPSADNGTPSTVTFNSTITGSSKALTIGSNSARLTNVTFGDALADTVSEVTDLAVYGNMDVNTTISTTSVFVSGTSQLDGASITTTGTQEYTGAVTLGADTTLLANGTPSADNGTPSTVTFNSTITGSSKALTIGLSSARLTNVTFGDNVADIVTGVTDLAVYGTMDANTTISATSVTVTGTSQLDGGSITTTGDQLYSGNVNLGANTTLTSTGGDISIGVVGTTATVTSDGNSLEVVTPADKTTLFSGGFADAVSLSITGNTDIYGDNTFTSLTIDNSTLATAATTVKFENGKLQTINGTPSFKGNSTTYTLTLAPITSGTNWNVYFATIPTTSCFSNVKVDSSSSFDSLGTTAIDLNLIPGDTTVKDFNVSSNTTKNWFTNAYYWLGGTDSSWSENDNWAYDASGTNMALAYPPYTGSTSEIVIRDSDTNVLKLTDSIAIKTMTVDAGKKVDFNGQTITATSITNNGTILMKGSETLTGVTTKANDSNSPVTSTIEYYGAITNTTFSNGWGTNFSNIVFADGSSGSSTSALTVNGTTEILSDAALSLTGGSTFNGAVTINAGNAVTLSGSNTISNGVTLTAGGAVSITTAAEFSLASGASCSSLEVTGAVTLNGDVTTTGSQTYNGAVTLSVDTTLIANSTPSATGGTTSTVKFNGNISGGVSGSEKSLIIGNGTGTTITAATNPVFGDGTNTAGISNLSKLTVYGEASVKKDYTVNAVLLQTYNGNVTNYGTIQASGTGGGESGENILIRGNYTATDGTNKGSLIGSTSYCVRFEQADSNDIHVKMGDYTHNSGTICFFGAGTGDTYFEPGDSEYNFIYCRKTGTSSELIFAATAIGTDDQPLVQNLSTGGLYVENGTVQFGAAKLVLRALSVTNIAKFIQTGSNGDDGGTNSLATLQRVGSIVAGGTDSVKWDSSNQGGSLYLYGNANIVTENYCNFGQKKVYTKADLTLSGAFYDLIIPSGVTVTNYESGQIRVRRNLTIQNGGIYVHNNRLLILGNSESSSDSVDSGVITDLSTTSQLGTVVVRAAGQTKVLASSIQTSALTVASGTLAAGSASTDAHTINVSGNLEFTASNGLFTANKSTINLNGAVDQTFTTNAQSFYNVVLATGTTAVTTSGDLTATGALTVNTGRTLNLDTNNSALEVTGKTTNDGTINGSTAVVSPSDITFNGEYDGSAGILSASSGNTIFSSTPVVFNTADSSFTANTGTVKFTGSTAQTFNAAAQTLNNVSFENTYSTVGTTLTGSFTATGDVLIASGAYLSAGANTITLNGGNWSNTGTFNYGTGKIVIQDACEITGSTTFYDFECTTGGTTLTFEAGKTQTIASGGSIDIKGSSGSLITLESSAGGTAWLMTSTGTNTFDYVDVKDSTNTSTDNFTATNSTDSGNNIKWNFHDFTYTWVGGNSGNENSWTTKENWSPASVPGANTKAIIPSVTYYPILTDTTTVKELTIDVGAEINFASEDVVASDGITNNGTIKLTGVSTQTLPAIITNKTGSVVEYEPTAANTATIASVLCSTITASEATYYTLIVDEYVTLQTGSNKLTVNTELQNNGTVEINDASGSISKTDVNSGTFVYSAASTTVADYGDTDYYNLTISSDGTVSLGSAISVANQLSVPKGTLALGTNNATVTGDFVAGDGTNIGTLTFATTNGGILSVVGNVTFTTNYSTLTAGTGTVSLMGTGAQTLSTNDLQFYNVTLGDLATAATVTVSGATTPSLTVTGKLEVGTKHVLDLDANDIVLSVTGETENNGTITGGSRDLTFTGNYSGTTANLTASSVNTYFKSDADLSGTTFDANGGTVTFNGTGNQELKILNTDTDTIVFSTLTVNKDNGTFTETGAATLSAGILTLTKAAGITFNSTTMVTSSLTDASGTGDITFLGNTTVTPVVTFNTSGTVTLGDDGATEASADTITFNGGVTHTVGDTKLACALVTTDKAVEFGSTTYGIELTDATSITTNDSSGGNVTLNGAITNTTTSRALTIDAGSGAVIFGSAVGSGATPLGDLDVTSSTSITANNTIQSTKIDLAGGAVDLNGAVTATNGFESTGTTFDNTGATITTTDSGITINHTDAVTVAAALSSGADSTGDITVTSSNGTMSISGNITSGTGKITIAGTGATSLVAISGTVNSTTGDIDIDSAYTLGITNTITSTTGNVTIDSTNVATLSDVADIKTTTGNVTFGATKSGSVSTAGNITTAGVEATPSGAVTFNQATTLTGDITITTNDNSSAGGKVLFASTVDSDLTLRDLTITSGTGTVTFSGALGGTSFIDVLSSTGTGNVTFGGAVKASSVAITGTSDINGGSITTTGTQSYTGAVTLGDNTTLTSTGSGAITIGNDSNPATVTGTTYDLALVTDGTVTFNGTIGASDAILGNISQTGDGAVTFKGEIYSGDITDSGNGAVAFSDTVNATTINITGNTTFEGIVEATSVEITGTTAINTTLITTTSTQTYTGDVTLGTDTELTASTTTFKASVDGDDNSLEITGDAEFGDGTGSDTVSSITTLSVTGATSVNTGASVTTTGLQTYSGDVTNEGTIIGSSELVTFAGDVTNTSGIITSGSGGITFNGSITDGTLNGSSEATIKLDNASAENFTPTTFAHNGCSFVLTGEGATTIGNVYVFNSFICEKAGKTVYFTTSNDGTSKYVFGSLKVEGTSENPVVLTRNGSLDYWYVTVDAANTSVQYSQVSYSVSDNNLVSKVIDSSEGTAGTTKNWFALTYYWYGSSGSDNTLYTNTANWRMTDSGAGTQPSISPLVIDPNVNIVISDSGTSILKLTSVLSINAITVKQDQTMDFADYNVIVVNFANNGKIRLSGAANTITASGTHTYGNANTIEYYRGGTCAAITGTGAPSAIDYFNLSVTESGTVLQLNDQSITVDGTLSNDGTIEVNKTGVFGLTGTTDSDSGLVLYSSTTATTTTIPAIVFYNLKVSGGTWTDADAITVENDLAVTDGSFTCANDLTVRGSTSVSTSVSTGSLICSGDYSVTGTTSVSSGTFTVNNGTEDQTSSTGTLSLTGGNITLGNTAGDLFTVGSGGITIPSSVTSISGAGTWTATSSSISIAHDITMNDNLTFGSAVTLNADSDNIITISSVTGETSNATFNSTVDGGKALVITGNVDFNATVGETTSLVSVEISGTSQLDGGSITTTGTQAYTGAVTLGTDTTLTSSGSGTITVGDDSNASTVTGSGKSLTVATGGAVTFYGAIGASDAILGDISQTGDGAVTFKGVIYSGDITDSGSGDVTFSGAVHAAAISDSGTGSVTFSDTVNVTTINITGNTIFDGTVGATSVVIAGTTAINTSSITTTSSQTYTGNVTLGADTELKAFDPVTSTDSTVLFESNVDGDSHSLEITGDAEFGDGSGTDSVSEIDELSVSGTTTVNTGASITTTGSQTYSGDVTNEGTITGSSELVTFAGDVTNTSGIITSDSGGILFNGSITDGDLNGASGATITIENSNSEEFNPDTFTHNGCSFELKGSGDLSLPTPFTYYDFVCETPDKVIKFATGTLADTTTHHIITNNFTITGADGHLIELIANDTTNTYWYIKTVVDKTTVNYVSVEYSYSINSIIDKVVDSTEKTAGSTVNWFRQIYTWKGTSNSDWTDANNWRLGGDASITIANSPTGNSYEDIYVIDNNTDSELNLASSYSYPHILARSFTVKQGATIDLANKNLEVVENIVNNGTVILDGDNGQDVSTGPSYSIINSDGSTVQYENDTATYPVWGSNYCNLTVILSGSGVFYVDKDLLSANGEISFDSPVVLDSSAQTLNIISTSDGTVDGTLSGEIYFSSTSSLDAATNSNVVFKAKDILINSQVGSSNPLNEISMICEKLTVNKSINAASMSVKNSGLFLTEEDADITLSSGSFIQTSGGDSSAVQLAGGIITDGANSIDFADDVYLVGSATELTLGGGTDSISVGTVSNRKNLYVLTSYDESVKINSPFICDNFALFSGKISLGSNCTNLETTSDMILLNGLVDNSTSSIYYDTTTTVQNLYSYQNENRVSTIAGNTSGNTAQVSLSTFPDETPDVNTSILHSGINSYANSKTYAGSFADLSGKTITVRKNFYANGIDFTASSSWNLVIPDNDKSTTSFAEAYNTTVSNCTVQNTTPGGTCAVVSAAENCTDNGNNTGWDFTRPIILVNDSTKERDMATVTEGSWTANLSGTYTVYDDVIRVEFVDTDAPNTAKKIENSNNEISKAISNIKFDNGTLTFTGSYVDADCTQTTDGKGDLSVFYIKTNGTSTQRWNTDATGISIGADESTDRGRSGELPATRNILPNIEIPKALSSVYATLKDEHKNRIGHYVGDSERFTAVADRTSPVLVAVHTGQELHDTDVLNQTPYDSHNFIEFKYSEPVDIGDIPSAITAGNEEDLQNIKSTSQFDSLLTHGGAIQNKASGIEVLGFAEIADGSLSTGSRTSDNVTIKAEDNEVHALYRYFTSNMNDGKKVQTHRIRISIAGYSPETVVVGDDTLPFWPGFINESESPSGNITRVANSFIVDKSVAGTTGNTLTILGQQSGDLVNHSLPTIQVENDTVANTLYAKWDTLSPTFASYTGLNGWNRNIDEPAFEIIGVSLSSGTFIEQMEFHFFDNEQSFLSTDEYQWVTSRGWITNPISPTDVQTAYDISGGSRSFENSPTIDSNNKTLGGIRTSSLYNSLQAFTYSYNDSSNNFVQNIKTSVTNEVVFRYPDVNLATVMPTTDNLYLSLELENPQTQNIPLRSILGISYNQNNGYVTDLAGNRLKTSNVTSLDRSSPQISLTVTPVTNQEYAPNTPNEIYIVFTKQLRTNSEDLEVLPSQLELIGVQNASIDESVPARVVFSTEDSTGIVVTLTGNVTYTDLCNAWVRIKQPTIISYDSFSGLDIYQVQIFDNTPVANAVEPLHQHIISDFALNVVNPEYAYDNSAIDEISSENIYDNLYGTNEWAVRDFSGTQNNAGRLLAGKDIDFVASISGGDNQTSPQENISMFLGINPITASISDFYKATTEMETRLWLPTILPALNTVANTSAIELLQTDDSSTDIRQFFIPNNEATNGCLGYPAGSEVQFLFRLNGLTRDHDNDVSTPEIPIYAIRLKDEADVSSIDLWSFSLVDMKKQRGGVTVLNNVINSLIHEKVIVEVDMPQTGNLTVQVMTLDGNIVKTLNRGQAEKGLHYFRWDGTNLAGNPVARGLYFIRVVGKSIDETRKVLVIKE